jgi:glucoamylase
MHFAKILIDEGQIDFVRSRLYNSKASAGSVIKRDLEFVSHNWRRPSFDLWEEVEGDHFYTRMVQRRAMLEGADFASAMGDSGAAQWYAQQGREIERDLNNFWDSSRGHLLTTRNRTGGIDYKNSQLDSAIILGLLHGSMGDGFMSFKDYRVQATINKMADAFYRVYPINRDSSIPGLAIGRYPEDLYAGANFNGGNPWVLTTFAFAEAYYRMAEEYQDAGNSAKATEFTNLGDAYVNRVQYHSHTDGSLNEQIDRYSGYMMSVEDLTWNYASALTAYFARVRLANHH